MKEEVKKLKKMEAELKTIQKGLLGENVRDSPHWWGGHYLLKRFDLAQKELQRLRKAIKTWEVGKADK